MLTVIMLTVIMLTVIRVCLQFKISLVRLVLDGQLR
jgi:hypothetical protein